MNNPNAPGIAQERVALSDSDAAASGPINPPGGKRAKNRPNKNTRPPSFDLSKAGPILDIK